MFEFVFVKVDRRQRCLRNLKTPLFRAGSGCCCCWGGRPQVIIIFIIIAIIIIIIIIIFIIIVIIIIIVIFIIIIILIIIILISTTIISIKNIIAILIIITTIYISNIIFIMVTCLKEANVWRRRASGPQLWEWGRIEEGGREGNKEWKPDRAAKSLAFLKKEEEQADEDNRVDSGPLTKVAKKAKLNVSDKDSPYALIDKYFPERESYFYQNKDKFVEEYRGQETKTDIGNISPSEVTQWLLIVLLGTPPTQRARLGLSGEKIMLKITQNTIKTCKSKTSPKV